MPVSDCQVRDPRIRRTRQLLHSALQARLKFQNFDEITVQDITETATVNRATFYDHYTDKFALLNAMIAGGFLALLQRRNILYDGTCPGAARAIILATCDYLTQTQQDRGVCQRQSAFEPFLDAALTSVICRVLEEGLPKMTAATAGWAIYGAVKEWFRQADGSSAEDATPLILELVLPLLQRGLST